MVKRELDLEAISGFAEQLRNSQNSLDGFLSFE